MRPLSFIEVHSLSFYYISCFESQCRGLIFRKLQTELFASITLFFFLPHQPRKRFSIVSSLITKRWNRPVSFPFTPISPPQPIAVSCQAKKQTSIHFSRFDLRVFFPFSFLWLFICPNLIKTLSKYVTGKNLRCIVLRKCRPAPAHIQFMMINMKKKTRKKKWRKQAIKTTTSDNQDENACTK